MPDLRASEIRREGSFEIHSGDNFYLKLSVSGAASFRVLLSGGFPCLDLTSDWELLVEAEVCVPIVAVSMDTMAELAMLA